MSKVIRSVTAKFNADVTDFEKKLRSASKTLKSVGDEWKKAGTALTKSLTIPIAAASTAMVALAVKAGQYAEQISIAAQTTGMSVGKLQELRYVASQVDVEFETLTGSFAKFTRTLVQAQKPGTEQAKLFDQLGVKMKNADGTMRSLNDLYFDSIKALGSMTNETEQAQAASVLFGRSFQDLIPLIKTSGEELERLKKRAKDLNLVRSPAEIASLAALDDKIAEIKLRFESAGQTLALKFLPVMDKLVEILETKVFPIIEKVIDSVVKMIDKFSGMSSAQQDFTLFSIAIVAAAGPVITAIGAITKAIGVLIGGAGFKSFLTLIGLAGKAATATSAAAASGATAATAAAATATTAAGATAIAAGVLAAAVTVIVGSAAAIAKIVKNQELLPKMDEFGRLVSPSKSGAWDVNGKATMPQSTTAKDGILNQKEKPSFDTSGLTDATNNITGTKPASQTNAALSFIRQSLTVSNEAAMKNVADLKRQKDWETSIKAYTKGTDDYAKGTDKAVSASDGFKESILSFVSAIKDQTKAFANFIGLFDVMDTKAVSGDRLLIRLKKQVKAMLEWKQSLAILEKRGVGGEFINTLRGMGPSAGAEIKGLAGLTDAKLKEYIALYGQKNTIAGGEASKFVTESTQIETKIDKQINIYASGSKGDANTIADSIVKKLRVAGYRI